MKKVGVITFCNSMNYGAELQAFALQKKLNLLGADAEVIHIEKEKWAMQGSYWTILTAIRKRFQMFGIWGGTQRTIALIKDKLAVRKANKQNKDKQAQKAEIFDSFFNNFIKHSARYYTLDELREGRLDTAYDVIVAGSDQIWNYMQTHYLDVFFLEFAKRFKAKKVSYAASFSVGSIPVALHAKYKHLIENIDAVSVRELSGLSLVSQLSDRKAELVLDPTLLFTAKEWIEMVANPDYVKGDKRYVVIYTLSGSKYIYGLAKKIGKELNAEVVNIKSGYVRIKGDEGITHLYDVGPREFISIFSHAVYVITDSFHGTAFSINFNIPFTTLLNPVSNMNSRALSILELTNTMDRLIFDNGDNREPDRLDVDFTPVNAIINDWRANSLFFINKEIIR